MGTYTIRNVIGWCSKKMSDLWKPIYPMICPKEGEFIGWKKCWFEANYYDNIHRDVYPIKLHAIVMLKIPKDALRSSGRDRKCRCSKAEVLSIEPIEPIASLFLKDLLPVEEVHSFHDSYFIYRIGETVEVENFDTCRWNECAPGIHFFMTREEALEF